MEALDPAVVSKRSLRGLTGLVERIAPWLVEVGSWILGGLIALNLVVIAAILTVGPVDAAMLIAVTAFACALPLDVAGLVLLRLLKDVEDIRIDEIALQSFKTGGFPDIEAYFPPADDRESWSNRRASITLGYVISIAVVSGGLTLTGITASLWHMARWVAEAFLTAVAVSAGLVAVAIAHGLPPNSKAERELKRRYRIARSARWHERFPMGREGTR